MTATTTFYVMAPPDAGPSLTRPGAADRLVFVPDRFSILAFAFSIPWMLVHRMWTVFLLYLGITLAIELAAVYTFGPVSGIAALVMSFAFGLEAQGLRRWSLERKGYRQVGLVSASDLDEAETRFFHGQVMGTAQAPARQMERAEPVQEAAATPWPAPRIGTEQVIGLTLGRETRK